MNVKKPVLHFLKRLFHVKRVIVVTDHAVDYYPLGRGTQLMVVAGALGFISWASYSTGSYMAAEAQIQEKNRTIEVVSEENRKIGSQYSLLKRDLVRLQDEGKELSDYAKFVITQYEQEAPDAKDKVRHFVDGTDLAENHELVLERIDFLEERVEQLKEDNEAFVEAIRQRTQKKIDEFEDIIDLTGLSSQAMELKQSALEEGDADAEEAQASLSEEDIENPKGGPYIPAASEDVMEREKHLFGAIDEMMALRSIIERLPLDMPEKGRFTSGFGRRVDPFTRRLAVHTGLDIAGPIGSKAHAANDGVVTFVGRRGAYGVMVELDHGLGLRTRYGHLSKTLVKVGQKVAKGNAIGVQGSTGRSTGNHLHYEVRYNNKPLNPINFIKAGQHVSSVN